MRFEYCEACGQRIIQSDEEAEELTDADDAEGVLCENCAEGLRAFTDDQLRNLPQLDPTQAVPMNSAHRGDSAVMIQPAKRRTSSIHLHCSVKKTKDHPISARQKVQEGEHKSKLPIVLAASAMLIVVISTILMMRSAMSEGPVEKEARPGEAAPIEKSE